MWLIAQGVGVQLSFIHFMFFVPVIIIATFLPISIGGWGVRENTAILFLGTVGVNAEETLLISVIFGVIMILASLPGSMWMFDKFPWENKHSSESVEEEISYE
jgi:glycosyltransferase 2 family protein